MLCMECNKAMQRNYNKIYNKIWGEVFPNLRREVSISRKKISGIDHLEVWWKITKGAVMAVGDLFKGLYPIGNMIYYSASGGVVAIAYLVCPETPKWADDALGEYEDYFGN